MSHLWLRAESKRPERRAPLAPKDVKLLIDNGHRVTVEECDQRIFSSKKYQAIGCEIAPAGSWQNAPPEAYILGLKNLPESISSVSLKHKHIYFAHAFKGQPHAKNLLSRFIQGDGILFDLEYLIDADGNRVVAFGFYAGVAGAAIAILLWCLKKQGVKPPYQIPHVCINGDDLFEEIKTLLHSIDVSPSVLIIGAHGRCGRGVAHFIQQLGIRPVLWGRQDTESDSIKYDILKYDIMLNCIFVDTTTRPFLTSDDFINNQNLSIIADISCEPYHKHNPLPFYSETTTFENPMHRVWNQGDGIDLISIDNLPAFLPRESSMHFSAQLIGHMNDLLNGVSVNSVWKRAADVFVHNLNYYFNDVMKKAI